MSVTQRRRFPQNRKRHDRQGEACPPPVNPTARPNCRYIVSWALRSWKGFSEVKTLVGKFMMQTAIPLNNVYHIHIIAFMVYIFITLILRKKIINKSFNIKLIKIIMTEFLSETFSNLMILQHLSTSSRNMTKNLQRRSLSENALLMLRSRTATKS